MLLFLLSSKSKELVIKSKEKVVITKRVTIPDLHLYFLAGLYMKILGDILSKPEVQWANHLSLILSVLKFWLNHSDFFHRRYRWWSISQLHLQSQLSKIAFYVTYCVSLVLAQWIHVRTQRRSGDILCFLLGQSLSSLPLSILGIKH